MADLHESSQGRAPLSPKLNAQRQSPRACKEGPEMADLSGAGSPHRVRPLGRPTGWEPLCPLIDVTDRELDLNAG